MLEGDYPYTSGGGDDSANCLYSASKATDVTVEDWNNVDPYSNDDMKNAVAKQPLAVVLAANNAYIHSYASGVLDAADCWHDTRDDEGKITNLSLINHAVLIVGYGTDTATGLDYWLIRNSWNATWGDQGYVKIKIMPDYSHLGICGVQDFTVYPILRE